jgi:hypothetical protein
MVSGLAAATGIQATPTVKINGQEYQPTTPDALVTEIKKIVGNVPGLNGAAPPAQAPPGQPPAAQAPAEPASPAAPAPEPAPTPAPPTPTR